ncbi:hypothetical protein V2G26_007347 [Clonostachys chloroleuca]
MQVYVFYTVVTGDDARIAYTDQPPLGSESGRGVIVLLHGFPQTSYQFRHVIKPIQKAGYRVIVPNYRGAGKSSKPQSSFTKTTMAADILCLLDQLSIKEPVHMVGHDIGGMIAYAFATRYPDRTASTVWGECPLPSTSAYEENCKEHSVQQFHFHFHSVPDLPEALVTGREETYLRHFFDKLSYNQSAITQEDLAYYVKQYCQSGALRCAFSVYRAFQEDANENTAWILKSGKCKVRALGLSGAQSRHREAADKMMAEAHEPRTFAAAAVEDSGHYIAGENPDGFVQVLLGFIESDI